MLVPVILSGGAGTRLWPVSTENHPKQFHRLIGTQTLIQATVGRLDGLQGLGRPIVVCSTRHVDLVQEQIGDRSPLLITEPSGKNTAPAIAAACHAALLLDDDPTVAVLASDHLVADVEAFQSAIGEAARLSESGRLVTFGVVPDRPATGFGYIHRGEEIHGSNASLIDGFHEKPDAATAADYLDRGYLWNSGMFVFKAKAYLAELQKYRPDIASAVADALQGEGEILALEATAWESCPSESIDYAVMEHTARGAVLPLDVGWTDVGTWGTLLHIGDEDSAGNVVAGDVVTVDTTNSYVRSEGRLIVTIGLDDVVIVETPEAIVAVHKDRTEDIKQVVAGLPPELR